MVSVLLQYREEIEIPESIIPGPELRSFSRSLECQIGWCRYTFADSESLSTGTHKHQLYELHYIRNGELVFLFPDMEKLILKAEQFLIIPPETPHGIINESQDTVKFVAGFHLKEHQQHPMLDLSHLSRPRVLDADSSMRFVGDALLEKSKAGYAAFLCIPSMIDSLIISAAEKACSPEVTHHTLQSSERAEQILRYIRENIIQNITPDQVAAQYGVSTRQINRITVRYLHRTVSEIICDEKMKRIRLLLTNSSYSLTDIAMASGFSDEYSFSRFFRRYAGMPPGRYRSTHRSKDQHP